MMYQKISSHTAYEKNTGKQHILEVYKLRSGSSAPYYVSLDGDFLADAETRKDAMDAVLDTVKWYGWSRTNPNYA